MKKKIFQWVKQFIGFGIVGLSNTIISYVCYAVLVYFNVYYLLASIIGFILSVTNAFYWSNKYVFKKQEGEERNLLYTYFKTFLSYAGTGLVLSNILLFLEVDVLNISEYVGPVINLILTIPINFLVNKLWAYRSHIVKEEN